MGQASRPRVTARRREPRWRGSAVVAVGAPALAALAIVVAPPEARLNVMRMAIVVLGLTAAALLLRRMATATLTAPRRFEDILEEEAPEPATIPGLRTVDQTLRMAAASGFGAVFLLQPLLLELVRWRLLRNRHIDLDATPELARQTLGEPLWGLIRDRDRTAAWDEPGVRLAEIRAAVDDLERV